MVLGDAHHKDAKTVVAELYSNIKTGLSTAEAKSRLNEFGRNQLQEKKSKSWWQRLLAQFADVMILILLAAAVVSFVMACIDGDPQEFFEPVLILVIVVLNAIIGVVQENKAEKSLAALKKMSAPHARVLRDGQEIMIDAADLVPGDIIRLEAGDFVPADSRLISSVSLQSEEAALTGESVPSDKTANMIADLKAPLGDRSNMIYSGCSITYGTATAIVTATGMQTEMGKIAKMLTGETATQTPLQKKLASLGKFLGLLAIGCCAVIFLVGLLSGMPVLELFITAISLAVSAIPEGLPAIVTVVLALGVQRLAKKNALIRRLPAVETLGSASIICSDKTGTLTQNRMTLMQAYVSGSKEPEKISLACSEPVKKLLTYATLCCDGSIVYRGDTVEHIGDPTETAIVLAADQNGLSKKILNEDYPRVAEIPFDSNRKLMTTVNQFGKKYYVIVKGAFDMLAKRCVAGNLEATKKAVDAMGEAALRVLAIAYKEVDTIPEKMDSDSVENGLTMLGIVGMIDPPRPESKRAVAICRRAGIKPIMITGDHVVTAAAIARDIGIMLPNDRAITGAELDAMTDAALDAAITDIAVYARVSPENKIRIVKAWQRRGEVVAMTGDGVNDAPALKAADIGCAMGITGTDVAKSVSDITLTDDNFVTIVDAVQEGRGIYANIKKVVCFLLGTNIGEVLTVFFAMLLWHQTPLLSMQLLMINLVTDSLPAIALGVDPVDKNVMYQKPKPKKQGLFANGLGLLIVLEGIVIGVLSLIAFKIGTATGGIEAGRTMAFMVLAFTQVAQPFNLRSTRSILVTNPFSNKVLILAALISSGLMALVLFTPVGIIFGLTWLSWQTYLIASGLIFVPTVIMEIGKFVLWLVHRHQ